MKLPYTWQQFLVEKPYNNSMKNFYLSFLLLAGALPALAANELDNWQLPPENEATRPVIPATFPDDEIIIEMIGDPEVKTPTAKRTDTNTIYIFKRTAKEHMNHLAGKSRSYILFNADVVSSFDSTIYADNGVPYAFVRYGQEGDNYRKFLFEANADQKLLAVADNAPAVLAVNKQYKVNLGLTEIEFKKSYPRAVFTALTNAQNGKEYHAYQVAGDLFVIFENGKLAYQFDNAEAFSAYMNTLSAANMSYAAQQAKQQTELEKARQTQPAEPVQPQITYALVVGGTVRRPIYLPAIISTGTVRHSLPPLKPSGPPAGTVLMRDVDGKYMNYK